MQQRTYPVPQSDPPRSPRETLPTMYDLPSENPEEPGLPDEFHDYQPQLLSRTLRLADWATDRMFTGAISSWMGRTMWSKNCNRNRPWLGFQN